MEIVPLTPALAESWNAAAHASDDAWFWHTTHWMEWAEDLAAGQIVANRSFLVTEGRDVLAICPALVEDGRDGRRLGYGPAGPLPMAAVRNDIGRAQARVLDLYALTLAAIGAEEKAAHASVRVPSLSPAYLGAALPYANPLLRFGYLDLPFLTQIIDLSAPLDALWSAVRKGHKAAVRAAERTCTAHVWTGEALARETFDAYQQLHAKDAGRVTRDQRTFDRMERWIRDGHAALVEARRGETPVAFAYLILHKDGAFYGSACKDPDHPELTVSHLIQWTAIQWLKARGVRFYDVGLQQFGPQWFDVPSAKAVSISQFKRGFGGQTVPLVTAEMFFSTDALRETLTRRLDTYLAVPISTESLP